MKKIQMLGIALVALFAFSAISASLASAETTLLAEWLANGAPITTELSVVTTGLINLSTLVLGLNGVEVDCEGSFDGFVGPNGTDLITEVLNALGEAIGQNLVGLSLSCEVKSEINNECDGVGKLAELWVDNLPWNTNLELMESGAFLDHIFVAGATENSLEPGYHVFCPVKNKENLCTGLTSSTITNGATSVLGVFDATSEKATCTTGTGDLIGEGLTVLLEGTLTVSSE
jgi:hypothetical protein